MTKIEALTVAFAATSTGKWETLSTCGALHVVTLTPRGDDVKTVAIAHKADADFIVLAHELMPELLEAVKHLSTLRRLPDRLESGMPHIVRTLNALTVESTQKLGLTA